VDQKSLMTIDTNCKRNLSWGKGGHPVSFYPPLLMAEASHCYRTTLGGLTVAFSQGRHLGDNSLNRFALGFRNS